MPTFDEDNLRYVFTDTALFRRDATPMFLAPRYWPQRAWVTGDCMRRQFQVLLWTLPVARQQSIADRGVTT